MCDILLLKKYGYIHHIFVFLQHILIIIIMLVYVAWTNHLFMLVDHMEDALFYTNHLVLYPIYLGDSKRTFGIKWKLNHSDGVVHLFTVYMPCDDNIAMHHHDFNNILSSIYIYCLQHDLLRILIQIYPTLLVT